jgi:hypothetical protein
VRREAWQPFPQRRLDGYAELKAQFAAYRVAGAENQENSPA